MGGGAKSSRKWSRETFFVLACVGAAVGLGNLWRFPYMAYENGGGAFLLPFVVCLVLVGIPIALLEICLGRWSGGSVAGAFQKAHPCWTWVGWWALLNSLVIVFYYAVVINWCVQYVVYSFNEAWGSEPDRFFLGKVLGLADSPYQFGGVSVRGLVCLAVVWGSIFLIVRSGTKGLSRVLSITVPLPLILLVLLAWRSITLPGAADGLSYLFTPRPNELLSWSVWAAAASQVVLSLGLGMGQMVAYASRKRDDQHIVKSAITICSADLLFSLLAGVTVFATMGYLAGSRGVEIGELKLEGLFLAFVSYPMAISSLPLAPLWGVAFFALLVSLGIDSAFAVIEANITGLEDMGVRMSRSRMAAMLCALGFVGGILFVSGSGLLWLDIVDHWVAYYSIASIVVLQCIVFSYFAPVRRIGRPIGAALGAVVQSSWRLFVAVIIPAVMVFAFGGSFLSELGERYGSYPLSALLIGGWGVFMAAIVCGVLVAVRHNKKGRYEAEN